MHNKAMEMAKSIMDKACICGYDNLNSQDWDDFKDAMEVVEKSIKADYYYKLIECMEKEKEEEKREDAYFLKMLKEEKQDEYKRMKEEYGEDEGERRFYDNYRYKSSGRFAPAGRGSYMPRSSGRRGRRGYEEMPYPMFSEMYDPEYYRDLDREAGRMYFSGGTSGGNSSGSYSANSGGNSGGNSSGSSMGGSSGSRGYSEGYNDGNTRGYSDGYSDGQRDGRRNNGGNNSRYDRAKRGYEEAKEQHKSGTSEDKQITMREAEKFVNVATDEIMEMLEDASPEVKNMVKTKVMSKMQKMQ